MVKILSRGPNALFCGKWETWLRKISIDFRREGSLASYVLTRWHRLEALFLGIYFLVLLKKTTRHRGSNN